MDEYVGLPTPGAEELYRPSKLTNLYKPIKVDRTASNSRPVKSWTSEKTRILPYLVGFVRNENIDTYKAKTNKYGSSTELAKQAVTGRFYVTKIGERWWIVDPEGYLHYERSVCSFRKGGSERNATAFAQRFASDADWVATTQRELADIGFHGTGAFSTNKNASDVVGYKAVQTHNAVNPGAPLTLAPSFSTLGAFRGTVGGDPGGQENCRAALALYEGWEEYCKTYAKADYGYGPYLRDKNVLGIFSDNEIDFGTNAEPKHLLKRVLGITDKNNEAYKAAVQWCSENGVSTSSPTTDQCNKFAGYVADKYYKGVSEAIKAADPQMLYLGTRLHGQPKYNKYVIEAAGKWCDIVSINYYSRWSPELTDYIPMWATAANKPFLVTEFYTKGLDSDLANTSGAGFLVKTQRDRAYAYQHFTLGLLEAPNCVGWHWFKYQDDDGSDNSNKPANKGIYDNYYNIIPDMGKYAKDINIHVYDLIRFFDEGAK
ncbi:MAG: hypothetical protein IKL67_04775 [Tidjanibacter sp.]|nr:hypothetical protein [Tidjanibacter sp.]